MRVIECKEIQLTQDDVRIAIMEYVNSKGIQISTSDIDFLIEKRAICKDSELQKMILIGARINHVTNKKEL